MKATTPYLHFDGRCRAAIAFYSACFGGKFEVMPYPDASGHPNPDPDARVQHSVLMQGGEARLMASDYPPGTDVSLLGTGHFSVHVDCHPESEVDALFARLSQGGKVTTPPCDMPFGRFAMCTDPFGVSWILTCTSAA